MTILSTLPGESCTIGEGAAGATSGAAVTASDTGNVTVVVSMLTELLAVVTSVANVVLAVR